MAFAKNYAFFMLILFPCSLHVVHALNYATFSSGDGNFMLHWTYSNNKLVFNMTCKATGWCAVGFTENPGGGGMVNYDIAAGGVDNGTSYLEVSLYIVTVLFCSEVLNIRKIAWMNSLTVMCTEGIQTKSEFVFRIIIFLKYGVESNNLHTEKDIVSSWLSW